MLKFSFKYPFIRSVRIPKPEDYNILDVNAGNYTAEQQGMIKGAQKVLSAYNIPLNKVRFVFTREFEYDAVTNKVNPTYTVMQPKVDSEYVHPISINKPDDIMTISTGKYYTDGLKKVIQRSKLGVVISLDEDIESMNDHVYMGNLDNAVEFYNEIQEEKENE